MSFPFNSRFRTKDVANLVAGVGGGDTQMWPHLPFPVV